MACCALLDGLSFSSFLSFRGCFGQALFPHFSPMDSKPVQRSALCRSRRELSKHSYSNEYLLAKSGFDTAENEPCKVCPLSVYYYYRSHRFCGGLMLCVVGLGILYLAAWSAGFAVWIETFPSQGCVSQSECLPNLAAFRFERSGQARRIGYENKD